MDVSRNQTNSSFRQKWQEGSDAFLETTLDENSEIFKWITRRNGFKTAMDFSNWLSPRRRILDAGCGNGRITNLLRNYADPATEIIGVDYSSHDIATDNFMHLANTTFLYADLIENLEHLGTFDLIYCQEVLHHTQDPKRAFRNLVEILRPKGEIAVYVYKKKSEIREFSDDYIRGKIEKLTFEEAKEVIAQITEFARVISKIPGSFVFPSIPILGIKESQQSFHRFIYNNLFKNFWNEELSYKENFLVNFDWYHPSTCFRHTMSEVLEWFEGQNLKVIHSIEDDYGLTVRGVNLLEL
jgi:2-polyprenyl-3-methyl-5-hydroxy-6-metoxy-1,4-benzoquinol methylase